MTRRTVLLLVVLAAVGSAGAFLFRDSFDDARVFRPVDYMEYYAAGRATLNRQNPYDGAAVYPYQVDIQAKLPTADGAAPGEVTRYADPIMMWNPPWTLPLTLPLGAMHWRAGQLLWTAANLVAVVLSAVLLWRAFGGAKEKTTVAIGVAVVFAPTLFLLLLGQISGFLLLGLAGFVWWVRSDEPRPPGGEIEIPLPGGRGSYWLAGLFAALTAIKPHLLVPFALVLLLETLRGGRAWRSVVAGGLALVAFGLLPLLWNPDVWTQYREATAAQSAGTHNTPNEWMHPTLGYWLRTLHPDRPFALMFLPLAVALPAVAAYWWVRRKAWNWATELPRLVLVSLLTAPYGAWGFDLVLLLVPVVQAAVWVANDSRKYVWFKFGGAFAALTLLALFTLRFENSMANWWLTPAVTVGYLLAGGVTRGRAGSVSDRSSNSLRSLTLPARHDGGGAPVVTRFLLPGVVLLVLLAGTVAAGWYLTDHPEVWPPDDYVEYWAAGRLNLTGGNPYSAEQLLPLERSAGRDTDEAIMMWNPPWTLAVAMPLGALPPRVGQVAWMLLSFAAVGASVWLLWGIYGGRTDKRWVGLAVAFTFVPTLFVLQTGQISALLLLGCALFAWCVRRGYHFAAGAAAVLVAIKPHLAYLLWLGIALDAVVSRRWRIVLGGVVTGVIATAIPMALNPDVWAEYGEAYRNSPVPPSKWVSLTLGVVLRLAWGTDHFWLQFVPMGLVVVGFGWHWHRHRKAWDWAEQLPSLVACSFVTAPYGAWHFDLVLLLLPVLHRAAELVNGRCEPPGSAAHPAVHTARSPGWVVPLVVLVTINVAMFAMSRVHLWSFWYCWVAPLVLVGYAFTARRRTAPALVPA